MDRPMKNVMQAIQTISLAKGQVLVVGCSTSEVAGGKIGTAGTMEQQRLFLRNSKRMQKRREFHLAFQCCEHLNRALVMERQTAIEKRVGRSNRHPCERRRRGDGNVCLSAICRSRRR